MKKVLFLAAAFLLVSAMSIVPASGQTMLEFASFCDGLSLTASGGVLSGEWCSYDCGGSNDVVEGSLGGGTGRVLCGAGGCDTCVVSGAGVNWGFSLDGLDGTMVMFQGDAGCNTFSVWIDPLEYNVLPGDCSANPGAVPGVGGSVTKGWIE